jgi:ABC-type hemin transport system ATPase subunit
MDIYTTLVVQQQYGAIPANFHYDLRTGYTVLLGPNNAGKSALLQALFRKLAGDDSLAGLERIALILPDRQNVQASTETAGRVLASWNQQLLQELGGEPLRYGGEANPPSRSELARILMHGSFIQQNHAMNNLLERIGLPSFDLREGQQIHFGEVLVHLQGTGLRGAFPILAALTHPRIQAVLIDEPELSLEPRLQKVLRDILIETSETRIIVVATHSHLFLRRDVIEANQVIERTGPNEISLRTLSDRAELLDLTFDLLGSSTEDLFFPGNYVIVEGASDQEILAKVLDLLGRPSPSIKVLAARGIDSVRDAVEAVYRASVPLIVNDSPYARRVVALIDQPSKPEAENLVKLKNTLGDRLYTLDQPSIEEYLPAALYAKAGRNRDDDLAQLSSLKQDRAARNRLKKEIAVAIASVLRTDDFDSIPTIVQAAQRAIAEAT